MKNKWMWVSCVALAVIAIGGFGMACGITSPIVGKWQDTQQSNLFIEFFSDGNVIFSDGELVISGKYELVGDEYVKVKFEGLPGAFMELFFADTWQFQISGDTMTLQAAGETSTLRRVP